MLRFNERKGTDSGCFTTALRGTTGRELSYKELIGNGAIASAHESPAKDADNAVKPGSLSRFKALTARLFAVDPEKFQEARLKDEEERRAKDGR